MHALIISHFRFSFVESGCVKGFIVIWIEHIGGGGGDGEPWRRCLREAEKTATKLTSSTDLRRPKRPGTIVIYSDKKIHCISNGKVFGSGLRECMTAR